MNSYMRKVISVFVVTMLMISMLIDSEETYADSLAFKFTDSTVVLMPEYNKHPNQDIKEPNLLVGFHGTILNQSQEPLADVTLPLPSSQVNFELSLIASPLEDDNGGVKEIDNKVNEKEGTITLYFDETIQPSMTKKIMIEYFYTPISVAEGSKSFTYDFTAAADAESMNLLLFEPYYSEEFTAIPVSDKEATDSMGVKMHLYQYQDIKQGDTKHYEFSYKKDNDLTTVELVEQVTSSQIESSSEEDSGIAVESDSSQDGFFSGDILFAIILIVIVLIVFAGWFARTRRKQSNNTSDNSQSTRHTTKFSKKELRRMLTEGEINEEQYINELKKLG